MGVTLKGASCPLVLFFDEFDAVTKRRGDTHATGEIKRVVTSLLIQVARVPNYGDRGRHQPRRAARSRAGGAGSSCVSRSVRQRRGVSSDTLS